MEKMTSLMERMHISTSSLTVTQRKNSRLPDALSILYRDAENDRRIVTEVALQAGPGGNHVIQRECTSVSEGNIRTDREKTEGHLRRYPQTLRKVGC